MDIAHIAALSIALVGLVLGASALVLAWTLRRDIAALPVDFARQLATALERMAISPSSSPSTGSSTAGASPPAAGDSVQQPILDPQEPYLALDNMGALYAILLPEEVEAAQKAGRQIVSFTPLSEQETKVARNNLLNAALESMPAIEDEGPISAH